MRSGGWLGVSRECRPQPVPSWPTVIATTLRLWLQRHVISPRPNRGQHGHYWRLGLTVLAVVVLGAVVAVVTVTAYAPVVIASFGAGADLVQVRVTAAGSAAACLAAIRADVRARKLAGTELAGNKNIRMRAAARAALIAGRVDSRLLITLGALTHRFPVRIVSIGDGGPDAAPGVPLRQLTVAPGAAYLGRLLAFLRAQRPPLRPLVSLRHHDRTTDVQIKFSAPSPTGLLSAGESP